MDREAERLKNESFVDVLISQIKAQEQENAANSRKAILSNDFYSG